MKNKTYHFPDKIITGRCIVRPPRRWNDVPPLAAFYNAHGQDFTRETINGFHFDQEISERQARDMRDIRSHHFAKDYCIFRKGKPEIIGAIGATIDRLGTPRLGFYISPAFRRQGYAREVQSAVLDAFLKTNPQIKTIWAEVMPDNTASRRILAQKGFRQMGMRQQSAATEQQTRCLSYCYPRPGPCLNNTFLPPYSRRIPLFAFTQLAP